MGVRCACPRSDRGDCLRFRYNLDYDDWVDNDREECECACHNEYDLDRDDEPDPEPA